MHLSEASKSIVRKVGKYIMRILTVGFGDQRYEEFVEEIEKYFICIVDNAQDLYDATNFTDF